MDVYQCQLDMDRCDTIGHDGADMYVCLDLLAYVFKRYIAVRRTVDSILVDSDYMYMVFQIASSVRACSSAVLSLES